MSSYLGKMDEPQERRSPFFPSSNRSATWPRVPARRSLPTITSARVAGAHEQPNDRQFAFVNYGPAPRLIVTQSENKGRHLVHASKMNIAPIKYPMAYRIESRSHRDRRRLKILPTPASLGRVSPVKITPPATRPSGQRHRRREPDRREWTPSDPEGTFGQENPDGSSLGGVGWTKQGISRRAGFQKLPKVPFIPRRCPLSGRPQRGPSPANEEFKQEDAERLSRRHRTLMQRAGNKRVATLQREHVVRLLAARAEKPEAANRLRKALRL